MSLRLIPLERTAANLLVAKWHRHNKPVPGAKFCIGVARGPEIHGCAIVGRPVARAYDDGLTLEVTRVATDGTRNACSILYGAVRRATFALGFTRLITYTRTDESGASLRAAGFRVLATREARSWGKDSVKRPRVDQSDPHQRILWEA